MRPLGVGSPHVAQPLSTYLSVRYVPLLLLFVSQLLFHSRGFAEASTSPIDAWNVHKTIAIVVVSIAIGLYLAARGVPRRWPAPLALFACYLCVGVLSTVHSPRVLFSYWKLTELLAALLVAVYVLRQCDRDSAFAERCYGLWRLFLRFLIGMALLGAVIDPSHALTPPISEELASAFDGTPLLPMQLYGIIVLVNANSLGAMAAILLYGDVLAWVERRGWKPALALWILADALVLLLAQSRTAWAGFAVAVAIAILFSRTFRLASRVAVCAILAALALLARGYIVAYLTRGTSVEYMSQMTGRADWWTTALGVLNGSTLFQRLVGLGFVSANRAILSTLLESEASTLHSDYVDALVSTGYVGAGFLIVAVLALCASLLRLSRRRPDVPRAVELGGVAAILLVRSFTGTTFAIYGHFVEGFLLISVLVFVLGRERAAAPALPRDSVWPFTPNAPLGVIE